MSQTPTTTALSSFQIAAAAVRDELREQLNDTTFGPRYELYDSSGTFRFGTSRLRKVAASGVVGWIAVLLVVGSFFGGAAIAGDGGLALVGGCVIAVVALLWGNSKFIAPALLDLSRTSEAFLCYQGLAVREIQAAVDRGVDHALDLLAAVRDMQPGVEELLEELTSLDQAISSVSGHFAHVAGPQYQDALADRRQHVLDELVEVSAEITAAARMMFSTRPDLLAVLPPTAEPLGTDAPVSVLTVSGQRQLSDARARLARVATRA